MMGIKQQGGVFGRNPTFNNLTVDGVLTASGVTLEGLNIVDGNIVMADGKGIDFSATSGTGTSELLDDYEEGTWTPAFAPATGSFTTMTYRRQQGRYIKIGKMVYVVGQISTSEVDVTGASGTLNISGLPFATESYGSESSYTGFIGTLFRWNFASAPVNLRLHLPSGNTVLNLNISTAGAASEVYAAVSDLTTGVNTARNWIAFSAVYQTA